MKHRLFVACLFSSASLFAQTTVWVGSQSSDWNQSANWSNGVPSAGVDVSIPARVSNQPALSGAGSCRALTVAAGASLSLTGRAALDVYGGATSLGTVSGSGTLTTRGGTATLTGRFGNVDIESACRLTAGSMLTGTLTANNDALIYSGCVLGSLRVGAGATVSIERNATTSVVITGALGVSAGGSLANDATVPLVLRGTTHDVAGPVRGDLALEVSAMTRFGVRATIAGDVAVTTVAGQRLTIAGSGIGRIAGTLTVTATSSSRGELYLNDLQAADVSLTVTDVWIVGTVECAEFRLFNSQLRGGTEDELIVDTMVLPGASQLTDSPPGRIVVRSGVTINSSNNFAPVRGTIVFNDQNQGVTVAVSDNPLPRFSQVRVENGAQVLFRSGSANSSGQGPRIDDLIVADGSADAVFCVLEQVVVEASATLTVRTEQTTHQCVVGPTIVRGMATFSDTDFGNSTLANSLTVDSGGDASIGNGSLTVTGNLVIGSGRLRLGAGVGLLLAPAGHLRLDGTPLAPAVVEGSNSPMQLDGTIEARSFRFAGMNNAGVRIGGTAVLGAVPFDLRGGHFTNGRPGGVLLDLFRSAPTTLFDLDFEATGGATRNVRTTVASAPITIVDARGDLAGEAFDDDVGNRIGWRANATAVSALAAQPGVHRNTIAFTSTVEETTTFRLGRSPGPALAPIVASGPRAYVVVDDGLLARTRYTYTLERQRLSPFAGEWQPLATVAATPHAAAEGVTRFVGPNGYADVTAALVGAVPGTIVFVAAGSYGGFSITQPARVIGDGGVTIHGPVSVANVQAVSGDVVLDGLALGPSAGLTVADTSVPVILRALTLPGDATIERSDKVAVQRIEGQGRLTLRTAIVHVASSNLGMVDVTQSSRLVHAATVAASITADVSSVVTANPDASALLDLAPAWPSGGQQTLRVQRGGGGDAFALLLGTAHDYLDLSASLPLDMVLLLSPSTLIALPGGVLDSNGSATVTLAAPAGGHNAGLGLQVQVQTLNLSTARGRFAELRQILFLR